MKLKIGDKVRILDGGSMNRDKHIIWSEDHIIFVGIETCITRKPVSTGNKLYYKLNIDSNRLWFVEDWLEKVR